MLTLRATTARWRRWRRDERLRRTAERRPDLVAGLDPDRLDARDREVLAEEPQRLRDFRDCPCCGKLGPCVVVPRPCHGGGTSVS